MNRLLITFALALLSSSAYSQQLATCNEPTGYAFFPQRGIIKAEHAGWEEDRISAGLFTLRKVGAADYDILYVDATKQIRSAKGEGGIVKLLRSGDKEMAFILFYPGSTIEIYTFMQDSTGQNQVGILTSKGGEGLVQHKQSAMIANCSSISFVTSPTKAK